MPVLVTGATGFIGYHVARELIERGATVRCLVRPSADPTRLQALGVELVRGDLRDADSLRGACRGCPQVYHVAADYRLWAPDPQDLYRTNVEGTRALLAAAERAERVVYTSSVGCLGLRADGQPADETTPVALADMVGHYKRSKYLAEEVARERAAAGQPIVIVNPSTPVGDFDVRPTPTGQIIVDFLRGRMPGFVNTGLNLVDVRDVALGHLLAAERGRLGERYILGHRDLTLEQILAMLASLTGRPRPRLKVPFAVAFAAAYVDQFVNVTLRHRAPGIPLEGVRMARHLMYFSPAKAVAELGLPQSSVEGALERAIAWFSAQGYVTSGR
ncbi:MAG: NAD-dependent epimerase/dehydratase family protein [Armatimonadetes bacterium]|nr:NAD-dependent epimerase/dehydratase family protein [Armatimonadota bacterium]